MPKLMQLLGERCLAREKPDVSHEKPQTTASDSTIRAFFKGLFEMFGKKRGPNIQRASRHAHLMGVSGVATPRTPQDQKHVAALAVGRKKRSSSTADIVPTVGRSDNGQRLNRASSSSSRSANSTSPGLDDVIHDERQRCAKIIAYGIQNDCLIQAGIFAFDTDLGAAQAIDALAINKMPHRNSPRFDRAALYVRPGQTKGAPDPSPQEISPAEVAAKITAAADKARGNPHYAREAVSSLMARRRIDATAHQAAEIVKAAAKARGETQPKE